MSDLQKYIARRKLADLGFSENYESGYREFKVDVMLKIFREEVSITQEQLVGEVQQKTSGFNKLSGFMGSSAVGNKRENSEHCT